MYVIRLVSIFCIFYKNSFAIDQTSIFQWKLTSTILVQIASLAPFCSFSFLRFFPSACGMAPSVAAATLRVSLALRLQAKLLAQVAVVRAEVAAAKLALAKAYNSKARGGEAQEQGGGPGECDEEEVEGQEGGCDEAEGEEGQRRPPGGAGSFRR